MSKKIENIPKSERSEIVNNILGAKNRKEQLKIEADLHLTSVTTIKEILKDYGVNLKIFNGGSRKKKHIEDELAEEQEIITPVEEIKAVEEQAEPDVIGEAWRDLSIPPDEPLPSPLPDSSTSEETAAEEEQEIDFDMSYQRFKKLIREKMHCENRLEEIKAELQLYRDTCNCILLDLKSGGMEA